jgi:hypothetical protein
MEALFGIVLPTIRTTAMAWRGAVDGTARSPQVVSGW